jgi:hypothetical protein
VKGDSVFSKMKYESGVHRVQRVPATETQGAFSTLSLSPLSLSPLSLSLPSLSLLSLSLYSLSLSKCSHMSSHVTQL